MTDTSIIYLFPVNLHQFGEESVDSADGTTGDEIETGDADQISAEADKEKQFEQLISGDYKDVFGKRVQGIIDKRFKETKTIEAQATELKGKYERLFEAVKGKYNAEDLDEIINAIDGESIEQEAYERGMDVEDVRKERENKRQTQELVKQNKKLQEQLNTREQQERLMQRVSEWRKQEVDVKKLYPDFSLQQASENSDFLRLLNAGVQVQTAYETAFPDKFKARVEGAIVKDSKSRRPSENAASQQKTNNFNLEKSVSNLTKEERRELAERAKRGETITFR